jgi:cell division protein FtsW
MIMQDVRKRRPPPPHQQRHKESHDKTRFALKIKKPMAKFDIPLFMIVIVLLVFGAGILLSSSFSIAAREHGNSYHYFVRQLGFIGAGLVLMLVLSIVPYSFFLNKKIVYLIAGVSVALMLGVLSSGVIQGGAQRWISIGGITFQPSEILKFALIVVLSYMVHKYPERLKSFKHGFIPFGMVIAIACCLTILQPHLSGTIILFAIGLTMMIVSPVKFEYVFLAILAFGIIIVIAILIMNAIGFNYMGARWLSFVDPEADIQGQTFQTYQSLVTIGSGGWFGLGLGNSRQKFSYLPFTHNDFIFPVVVEELGFVGGVLVLLLFVIFVMRGFYIATLAPDRFSMMLAVGITAQIGIQAFLNIAVATNTVPNTGILLPFFSYGGTATIVLMAQVGILLSISRKAAIE